jgi:hypothetical protein
VQRVAKIWYRTLTRGDFFHIERRPDAGPAGGGGQTYVDIPQGLRVQLFRLLDAHEPTDGIWPTLRVEVAAIGAPDMVAPLRFEFNRAGETRYRIARQQRQLVASERHPAWTGAFGFPVAPDGVVDPADAERHLPAGGVRMYLVLTDDGSLYAGHTFGPTMPASWPIGVGLEVLFVNNHSGGGLVEFANGDWRPGDPAVFLDPTQPATPFSSAIATQAQEAVVPDVDLPQANVVQTSVVDVEGGDVETFARAGTPPTISQRREHRLVQAYQSALEARDHVVTVHEYSWGGEVLRLRCDLFDETASVLIEAKGTVTREAVRMAIGQLMDYRRFEPEGVALVVLLPWMPSTDLIGLIHSVGATPVWLTDAGLFASM